MQHWRKSWTVLSGRRGNRYDRCLALFRPEVFNPPRPVDNFIQGDAEGDGIGDACDRCPLDPGETICTALFHD